MWLYLLISLLSSFLDDVLMEYEQICAIQPWEWQYNQWIEA